MKEIKSVRVRRRDLNSGNLDIKVTIYEEKRTFGADERILVGFNNDRPVWIATTYRKKDIYKEFTDDQFIDDFITLNSKIDGGGKTYDIIQDPWEIKTPKWRYYGSDPYYLNNGAQIFISWTEGNFTAGGLTYSDDSGKEINGNVSISKTVFNIIGIDEPSVLQYGKSQEIEYKSFDVPTQVYGGLFEDIYIIQEIIAAWKRKVPNYELALCSPDNEKCSIIPYKSPLKPPEPEVPPTIKVATNEAPKEKMTVVLPPDVVKVKSDITSFVVYVGKGKEKGLLENPSTEEDEFIFDDSSGIDEYTEDEFTGQDEFAAEELSTSIRIDYVPTEADKPAEVTETNSLSGPLEIPKPKEGEMTISAAALKKLKTHEGSKATIYDDGTGKSIESYDSLKGFPTIGVGHLISKNERTIFSKYLKPGKMSDSEIDNLLLKDLASRIKDLNKKLKVKVTQGQFDALLSMGFNTGFGNTSFLKAVALTNEGKKQDASVQINSGPKTSKGKVLAGLVTRRKDESVAYLA
jgi:lysozyme